MPHPAASPETSRLRIKDESTEWARCNNNVRCLYTERIRLQPNWRVAETQEPGNDELIKVNGNEFGYRPMSPGEKKAKEKLRSLGLRSSSQRGSGPSGCVVGVQCPTGRPEARGDGGVMHYTVGVQLRTAGKPAQTPPAEHRLTGLDKP